jgi:hypothetical protein
VLDGGLACTQGLHLHKLAKKHRKQNTSNTNLLPQAVNSLALLDLAQSGQPMAKVQGLLEELQG